MHGATLLGKNDEVLRPCILWNDGRSAAECAEMEAALPSLRDIAGNIAMPGFTAPKIAWVRKHEPEIYAKIAKVLLPKAYVRLLLTGEHVEDMSRRLRHALARCRQARLVRRTAGASPASTAPTCRASSKARPLRAR